PDYPRSGRAVLGDKLGKVVQLVAVEVGHQPEAHAVLGEALDVEAVARKRLLGLLRLDGPDEYVDQVRSPLVDEHRDRLRADVIQSSTDKVEAGRGKIRDRRREREPSAQPRLDRMLVG